MKTTDFIVEYAGIGNDAEAMGQDHEVQLARQDLYNTAKNAIELHARLKSISEETGLEGWVSEKITLAADYLATVNNYFAEQDQPDMDMLDSFSFESAEQQFEQLVNESAGDQAWSAGYQAFLDDVVKCPYPAGSDNAHTWSLGWESAQSRERTSESVEHPDEEEDKKLIKKMVKPTALNDGKVDEAFPHDVDHMPGRTVKNPMSGCKRCHGYGKIWKSPDGKVLAGNDAPGAKRYKCGACKGVGFVKEEGVTETSKAKIDRYTKAASDAHGHADFMSRAAGPGQEKFAQDQRKIADKRAAGLRRAAERGEKSDVEEGWKGALAGAAIGAATLASIANSPIATVDGQNVQMAMPGKIPSDAKLVTDDSGKKIYVWRSYPVKNSPGNTNGQLVYRPVEESSDNEPFNYEEWKASSVKPRKPRGWRDAELLGQQQREADRKRKEESSQIDMTGQACEKCKKDRYQERSQHDDMEGKVTCSCGHRVDRWKNYQAEGVADVVKGIKRKVAGKQDPKEVQYQHGFRARQAIDASRKFNNQAAYDNEKKMVDRYNRVHKVVNKEGVEESFVSKIANKVMGAAPEQPKYKVGQRVKYETSPHQPEWKDGGRGVGVITAYKNGHYMINGNPVNHFEIKGVVDQGVAEGYTVTRGIDRERYQERAGLEGPFATKIGKVVYYDPREGKYYDPDTDMYIEYDDWRAMNEASDPSGIFTAAQYNHAFIVTAEVDGKRKKFRVYHQNANLAKQKFLQHHSMATVLDVKPEAAKGVTEESDDDSFNAAYVAGLRHGSAGVGNNMDRAKKEWGSSFADYNRGFLKGRNSKAKSLKATGQGYGKKQQVAELDASTMQAYLAKRKETTTPATAHKAVKQAQGVRSAKEKIADKEIEARARRTGRVSESAGEPNTDQILEYLTSGYLMLRDNRNMFTEEGFATIERIYNGLRYDLKDGNYAGFMRSYGEYMSKYPDASVELIDAMFEAAGLESEKGTIDEFLALCTESMQEGIVDTIKRGAKKLIAPVPMPYLDQMKAITDVANKRANDALTKKYTPKTTPVKESASAGGTSAGAIATGVAGATAGKPGTGKPKKVSNVIKRNKPAFGKGVY